MHICSIASGSNGNCIYIGNSETHLLVDVGISGKKVEQGLAAIGLSPKDLHGILITHEHSDHIKGLGVIARRYKLPIFATEATWNELKAFKYLGEIDNDLHRFITPDQDFMIENITISPFRTSHDAVDPVCYTFLSKNKKIGLATDLGCYDPYIKEKLENSDILFIEANHDIKMLEVGKYPYFLKQRILSDVGHLSNEMSGKLIAELMHTKLKHVVLGHLSMENNYPELAYESVKSELIMEYKDIFNEGISLSIALRDQNSDLLVI